jgi:hypothetical protein
MDTISVDPAKSSVVLDREPDQVKSLDPSGPPHPLPYVRLVAPQEPSRPRR